MEDHAMLYADYFVSDPINTPKDFHRRYRMNELFMMVVHGVREYDGYFMMKKDSTGMTGFSSIQKYTSKTTMFTYGAPRY
jgi:hypothetical protein